MERVTGPGELKNLKDVTRGPEPRENKHKRMVNKEDCSMRKTMSSPNSRSLSWLLFFYSIPSKPVSKRMKIWRRLQQLGTLHLKGSVYLLPHSDERKQRFSELAAEVAALGGEADFVVAECIGTMRNEEVIALFNAARAQAYAHAEKSLHALEQKVGSLQKGSKTVTPEALLTEFRKIEKAAGDIAAVDFFGSEQGKDFMRRLQTLAGQLEETSHGKTPVHTPEIEPRTPGDYRKRVWATRPHPFVDRMASAWLIRRFIDPDALFVFTADIAKAPAGSVLFDIPRGDFTHHGDLCTFEVLIKSFGLKQKPLKKLAELVHELDIKDGRYAVPEASGIEELLTGIRKTAHNDADALEKGMAVFEMLYASKA